ncbi:hypothetical protein FOA43_002436 [Brettanomyces nanus]|uniref:Uncharacterized protein n=1 Tax=Eeniella nana TaxID=13502 RepID=A0A875S3Z7_EENNA|nr:uncharacterized protein FOA43_002436 [Brettanomyces nanus]QPG75095.1 hypothetical protein FOA43_002436 [Brettanomyces nanus]
MLSNYLTLLSILGFTFGASISLQDEYTTLVSSTCILPGICTGTTYYGSVYLTTMSVYSTVVEPTITYTTLVPSVVSGYSFVGFKPTLVTEADTTEWKQVSMDYTTVDGKEEIIVTYCDIDTTTNYFTTSVTETTTEIITKTRSCDEVYSKTTYTSTPIQMGIVVTAIVKVLREVQFVF